MVELPDRTQSFMDWYLAIVEAAELTDKRYPVKGMNVWTPYGFQVRRHLDRVLSNAIEASGSRPVEFPALIPETEFRKEREHIKGFDTEVFWVTRGGSTPLDIELVLRPTSETAMYPVFALWVRSHQDLPLNVYQIVNTFRYETKTTRPFLRVREIHFFEEHTCQADEAKATERVRSNLESFTQMASSLGLPYLALRRPEWDKFAGAFYTIGLDLPVGGPRTLQLGSIHHYRENFARPFGIQYETADGSRAFVHQTTFGLSERLIGAVLATHGDQKGAVFPTSVAPYEVVVIPISRAKDPERPLTVVKDVIRRLREHGVRVHLDDGSDRPGAKYYYWEVRGVPLRIEVGEREATEKKVTVVDRLGHKGKIAIETLEAGVDRWRREFDARLAERAQRAFVEAFSVASNLDDLRDSHQVRFVGWCGVEECGHLIEQAADGDLLGTLEGPPPIPLGSPNACAVCQKTENVVWAVAAQQI